MQTSWGALTQGDKVAAPSLALNSREIRDLVKGAAHRDQQDFALPGPQRRHRLARRHAVAPDHRVGTVEEAVRSVVVLHATEPATVHLSVAARAATALRAADPSIKILISDEAWLRLPAYEALGRLLAGER